MKIGPEDRDALTQQQRLDESEEIQTLRRKAATLSGAAQNAVDHLERLEVKMKRIFTAWMKGKKKCVRLVNRATDAQCDLENELRESE